MASRDQAVLRLGELRRALAEVADPARAPRTQRYMREYSRTDPRWVARYVREHQAELSPLSRREALRRLPATAYE